MPTPLEQESIFAALGLEAILRGAPRLTKGRLAEAAGMPAAIRRRLLRWMASGEFAEAKEAPPFDYAQVLGWVSNWQKTPDGEQAPALLAAVPDRELAHDLGLIAQKLCRSADELIPREPPNPVTNQPVEDPEPAASNDFARFWQVACNPLAVLDDLEDGSLIDDQVAALAQLYPSIYGDIRQAVTEVMGRLVARRGKKWEPLPTKAVLLATLKQIDDFDAELASAIQGVYAAEAAAQAAAAPPPPKRAPRQGDKSTEGTPGQSAAAS